MFFRDLIGHRSKLDELRAALRVGRLPHALLFTGKRGIGKSAAARALVTLFLCERKGEDGCGECDSCRWIQANSHPDLEVVERDASRRDISIDQLRSLADALHRKRAPAQGRAAFIDDADRMNDAAQNSFLKTLEEPPPSSLLILVTARPDRLLATIRSRCAIHRFGRLDDEEMEEFASRRLDPGGLPLALAQGAPGRWLELQDERFRSARVVLREGLLGHDASPYEFAADLMACATGEEDERQMTRDRLERYLRLLEFALRDLGCLAYGTDVPSLFNEDWRDDLAAAAARTTPERCTAATEAVMQGIFDLRTNVDPTLALEGVAMDVRGRLGF